MGYRIELGEIENAALNIKDISAKREVLDKQIYLRWYFRLF